MGFTITRRAGIHTGFPGRLRAAGALAIALAALTGCALTPGKDRPPIEIWDDMDRQPKFKAQAQNDFFADRRASRRPVPGTVARGQLNLDEAFVTGRQGDQFIGRNPLPFTREVLERGRQRYDIYCAPCHDRTGSGRGIVPARAPGWIPTNLHDERIRAMADGDLYDVISNGRRSMPGYRHQIEERDRWAIAAYVRALQRTDASIDDVPADLRSELR